MKPNDLNETPEPNPTSKEDLMKAIIQNPVDISPKTTKLIPIYGVRVVPAQSMMSSLPVKSTNGPAKKNVKRCIILKIPNKQSNIATDNQPTNQTSNFPPIAPKPTNFAQTLEAECPEYSPATTSMPRGHWVRTWGDVLQRKISLRPSREQLVTQHILHTDGRVSPLIEQRAGLLRKNRIKSNLSKKLHQRPGPLELITRKILQADAELERAIEEGRLFFEPTPKPSESLDERRQCPISSDMEVVSQPMIRQAPKIPNVLANKNIMRKASKPSPYLPCEPTLNRGKTKTPEGKSEEVTVIAERLAKPANRILEQNSYELLLQQQQLFLQWQQEPQALQQQQQQTQPQHIVPPQTQTVYATDDLSQVIELQNRCSPQENVVNCQPQPQPPMIRRLSNLKVQELKNECKKRQLPVSGAKPQLLDRLRPFEKDILGGTPSPSPDYSREPELPTPSDSNDIPMMVSNQAQNFVVQEQPRSVHTQEFTPQQAPCSQVVQVPGGQLVQLVDERGQVLGMATVLLPSEIGSKRMVVQQSRTSPTVNSDQQMARNFQSTQISQKPNDGTFRFAQMGSGGQFTSVQTNGMDTQKCIQSQPSHAVDFSANNNSNSTNSQTYLTVYPGNNSQNAQVIQTEGRVQQVQPQNATIVYQSHQQEAHLLRNETPIPKMVEPIVVQQNSPNHQSSPRSGDQADSSPSMPNCGGFVRTDASPEQTSRDSEDIPQLDPNDPASVLTPATLQMHEEMLRKQHKLIEALEKEVSSAQNMLKKQQQIILAAKKAQQKLREKQRLEGEIARQDHQWLRDIDIRHVNKQHIQQFLQHKVHSQNLNNVTTEHNRLKTTEARLQEELHVDQAVHDIVRLIKQDPRTALLIVQLLRKYQLERTNVEPAANSVQQSVEMYQQNSQSRAESTEKDPVVTQEQVAVVCEQQSDQPQMQHTMSNEQLIFAQEDVADQGMQAHIPHSENVNMDEIFKNVIDDASRAMAGNHTQTINCTVTASMDSPKQAVQQPIWQEMMRQSADIPHPGTDMQPSDHHVMSQVEQQGTVMVQQIQIHHKNMAQNFTPFSAEHGYSSLDDVMAVVQADPDFASSMDNAFANMEYGSEELAQLLGDDWLNCAERSIAHDGQYAPYPVVVDDGRSTDPMSLGAPMENMEVNESGQMNMNMDWLDEMLHHAPVDHSNYQN